MVRARPPEIGLQHLQRLAVVYRRQSSYRQVVENIGSAAFQADQADYARQYGWPESRIRVLDDLGASGKSVQGRDAYQQLVDLICANEAGALFLAYIDRGGREAIEYFMLFRLCRDNDVLVIVDGRPYDMRHSGSLLLNRIQAVIAEHDNLQRAERMMSARRAKAEMGFSVASLPAGYVRLPGGDITLDPDPTVQAMVRAGIDAMLSQRCIRRAVVELNRCNAKFPKHRPSGGYVPVPWKLSTLGNVLKRPIYRGELHFPLTKLGPINPATGKPSRVRTEIEERIVHHDRCQAYISADEAVEIDRILASNSRAQRSSPIGASDMILQSLLVCALHPGSVPRPRHLKVHPGWAKGRQLQAPYYICDGDKAVGGHRCMSIPARPIEDTVRRELFLRLQPARIEALRAELARTTGNEMADLHRLRRDQLMCEQRIDQLKTLLHDSTQRGTGAIVILEYEKDLHAELEHLRQLKRLTSTAEQSRLPDIGSTLQELAEIATDVGQLWGHPLTRNQDRKEIVRAMIKDVIILERTLEKIRIRILWADEEDSTNTDIPRAGYAHRVILDLAQAGMPPAGIARRLAEIGVRTSRDREWTSGTVYQVLRSSKYRSRAAEIAVAFAAQEGR